MSIAKKEIRLLDIYKSCLSDQEVGRYRSEITKQKNNPICKDLSTLEVALRGFAKMQEDGFCLLEGQLDV